MNSCIDKIFINGVELPSDGIIAIEETPCFSNGTAWIRMLVDKDCKIELKWASVNDYISKNDIERDGTE